METGGDEIPYVRCYTGDFLDNEGYVCVRLDRPEYADSGGKERAGFTTKQNKDDFIRIMNESTGAYIKDAQGNFAEMTGYLNAVQIWENVYGNGSYDKFRKGKNGLPEQPDYSVLKTLLKIEGDNTVADNSKKVKVNEQLSTTEDTVLSSENKTDEQIVSDYINNRSKYEPMCSLEEFCRKRGIEL